MWNEEAYDAFVKDMETSFPKMYGNDSEDAFGYGGFTTGPGWWPIIKALSADIQSYIDWANRDGKEVVPQVKVRQVKEKFGGLRFYYDGGDDRIYGMVSTAESWAMHSCETCSVPGKRRSGGWIRTLCDKHEEERLAQMKERAAL